MLDSYSYWVELEAKSTWLFKVRFKFKLKLDNLPEDGILTLRSNCTDQIDDKILVAQYNINLERQDILAPVYVGDITDVPKTVWSPFQSQTHNAEIDRLTKKLGHLKDNHIELKGLHIWSYLLDYKYVNCCNLHNICNTEM